MGNTSMQVRVPYQGGESVPSARWAPRRTDLVLGQEGTARSTNERGEERRDDGYGGRACTLQGRRRDDDATSTGWAGLGWASSRALHYGPESVVTTYQG